MRLIAAALFVLFTVATPVAAQGLAPEPRPYGLDPYKPSDAALLRNYGAALVAQTPLLQLSELDPYKPSHAALLRQIGGAMPLWSHLSWYPTAPAHAPLMTVPNSASLATQPGSGGLVIVIPGTPQRPSTGVPMRPLPVPPPLPPREQRMPPDTSIQRAALQ